MNLDSIHRFIEESQTFQMHQPSAKACCDPLAPAPCPGDACSPCLPPYGLQARGTHNSSAHSFTNNRWDVCEELRMQELEEVKARAAQMEKTMRWWSECTANWREKWSKVRAERNSAREEGRQLRMKLEMTVKELSALKKKQSLSLQKEVRGAKEMQDLGLPGLVDGAYEHHWDQVQISSQMNGSKRQSPSEERTNSKEDNVVVDPLKVLEETKHSSDCTGFFKNGGSGDCSVKPRPRGPTASLCLESKATEESAVHVPWEEFQKVLRREREMRATLEKEIERLESALSVWKWKYEELKESKGAKEKEVPQVGQGATPGLRSSDVQSSGQKVVGLTDKSKDGSKSSSL